MRSSKLLYSLIVFIGAAGYGALSTIAKIAYLKGYTPEQLVTLQNIVSLLFVGTICLILKARTHRRTKIKRTGKNNPFFLVFSGITISLTGFLYYNCVKLVPASFAIVLLFQFTWMGILLDSITRRRFPGITEIVALILIFVGTFMAGDFSFSSDVKYDIRGIVLGLLSALSYTGFIFANGRLGNDLPPVEKTSWMLIGAVLLVCCVHPPVFLLSGEFSGDLLKIGILMALLGGIIPTVAFAIGMPKIGVNLGSIICSVELPVAVIMSASVLHESVDLLQWFGVTIILAAVILSQMPLDIFTRKKLHRN